MAKIKKFKLSEDVVDSRHQRMSTRELRYNLADALSYTSRDQGKVILTKNGEVRAGLVSPDDVWLLDQLEEVLEIKSVLRGVSGAESKKRVLWSELKRRLRDIPDSNDLAGVKTNSDERGIKKTSS